MDMRDGRRPRIVCGQWSEHDEAAMRYAATGQAFREECHLRPVTRDDREAIDSATPTRGDLEWLFLRVVLP